jgi:putrescine aminotransferase
MLTEDTPRQSREKGAYMMGELNRLKDKYPTLLKGIRGRGMLIGMEFVDGDVGYQTVAGLFKRGVLTSGTLNNSKVIRIEPALNIPLELLDETISRLDSVLAELA